jgi:hypothetical protein
MKKIFKFLMLTLTMISLLAGFMVMASAVDVPSSYLGASDYLISDGTISNASQPIFKDGKVTFKINLASGVTVTGALVTVKFDKNVLRVIDAGPVTVADEDGNKTETNLGTWIEGWMMNKPSVEQLKNYILNAINKEVDEKILTGFAWNDIPVWLSTENQFNYKAAYDLAVMSQGKSLPITFKFGTTEEPKYYTFESLEDISDFYVSAMAYINKTLEDGWKKKDAIDWSVYEEALK